VVVRLSEVPASAVAIVVDEKTPGTGTRRTLGTGAIGGP
jgi:hypothetical protein